MATSEYYSWIGKSLIVNGDTFFTFYGKDVDANRPPLPSPRTPSTTYASWETSYNLSWFQPCNEVWCCALMFKNWGSSSVTLSFDLDFQKSGDGITYYSAWWAQHVSFSISANAIRLWYNSVGVDYDEIRIWETYYRFHITWTSTDWSSWTINLPFTVSNLSFDDSKHNSWYLWVEWNYLCYTDAIFVTSWYKHKINYDTGYNWWSGDPWYVWIPSSNDNHIYYTSADGTVRRTHISSSWYGYYSGNYAPSWAKSWMIWTSNGDVGWYGYLCYVNSQWQLRRMWNWEP